MKTLYEILEVSENASKEVIEKAYKVLAKKYHPDLQTPENKVLAEKKMKEINEAYEILGDDTKREEYNKKLANEREILRQKQEQINKNNEEELYVNQNIQYTSGQAEQERRVNDMQRRRYEAELLKREEQMRKQMQQEMQAEYNNAYYNYLRSLGFKIKERWTWKKTKTLIIIILVIVAIGMLLWFLPPTRKMMIDFYQSNIVIKTIIDIIINIISAFGKTITSIFN